MLVHEKKQKKKNSNDNEWEIDYFKIGRKEKVKTEFINNKILVQSTVHALVTLQRLLQNTVGSNSVPPLCFQANNMAYALSDIGRYQILSAVLL